MEVITLKGIPRSRMLTSCFSSVRMPYHLMNAQSSSTRSAEPSSEAISLPIVGSPRALVRRAGWERGVSGAPR